MTSKDDGEVTESGSTGNLGDNHLQVHSGETLHKVGKQESVFDWIEKSYIKAKDAAAGVLLLLSRECGKSHSSAHLGIIIESIQLFTFALSPMLDADDEASTTSQVGTAPTNGSIIENMVFFSDVSNLLMYFIGYEVCLFLTVSAVIVFLLNALYVAYGWSNTFNVLWPIKVLRLQANVLIGLAFIPTIQLMALMFSCSSFDLNCTAWQPLVLTLSIFYILLAIAIGSTYFDPIVTSESPQASAHTRITVFNILAKIVLSAVHAVWDSNATLRSSFAAELSRHLLLIGFSSALSYLYVWYQPYYHYKMNVLSGVTSSILLWFAVSMFVRWIKIMLGDPNAVGALENSATSIDSTQAARDVSVALVTGAFLVIPLTIFMIEYRKRALAKKPVYRLKNAYEFELKIRNYLRVHHPIFAQTHHKASSIKPLLKDSDAMNHPIDEDSSDDESDEEDQQPLFARESNVSNVKDDKNAGHRRRKQDRVLTKVQKLFESAISQFPGSAQLPMFMIYFFKTFYEKEQGIVLSRKAILIAARRKPWFDLEFGLFKLQSEIKHNVSTGKEVVSFVASEKYEREAKNYDRQSCWHLLEFWSELSASHPDMTRVQSLAKAVAEYSAKAQSAYLRLTRLQPKQARVLKLYSGFLNDVVNDRTAGQHAMSRAISYEEDKTSGNANNGGPPAAAGSTENPLSTQLHKFDPVMVFEISETTQHGTGFGEISYVNSDAAYVLQNASQKLVGRSVMEYLVPPFSTHLKGIVAAFFLEGRSPLFGRKIETFCVSSRKDCFQVTMQLSPYTTDGINFTMFLSFVPNERALREAQFGFGEDVANQGFFLFSDQYERGHVIAASDAGSFLLEKFTTLLDTHAMLAGSTIELKDIIEDSENMMERALATGDCVDVSLCSLRLDYENELHSTELKVQEFNYEGFRIQKATIRVLTKEAAAMRMQRRGSAASPNDLESFPSNTTSDDFSDVSKNESDDKFAFLSPTIGISNAAPALVKSPGSRSGSSVGSGKSGGSQSTVAGMYLRRLLQSEGTGKKMSPQLQRLSLVYVICLLVVVACSLVYYVIQERNLDRYASEVAFLNRAGFRRFNAVSLAYCTHCLVLLNLGVTLPSALSEESLRAELETNMESLRDIEKVAFSMRTYSDEVENVYSVGNTALSVLNGESARWEYTSLYDATSLVTGAATNLIDSPLEMFTLDNPNVHMVLTQVLGSVSYLQDLNRTTFMFQNLAESEIHTLVPIFWISVGIASFMQTLLLAYFIWPLVKLVERNKLEVLEVLRSIPPKSIATISLRSRNRLLEVHEVANEVLESQLNNSTWDTQRKITGLLDKSDGSGSGKKRKRSEKSKESPRKMVEKRLADSVIRASTIEPGNTNTLRTGEDKPRNRLARNDSGSSEEANSSACSDNDEAKSSSSDQIMNMATEARSPPSPIGEEEVETEKSTSKGLSGGLVAWFRGDHEDDSDDEDEFRYKKGIGSRVLSGLAAPFYKCGSGMRHFKRWMRQLCAPKVKTTPTAPVVAPLDRQDTDSKLEARLRKTQTDFSVQLRVLAKMAVPALAAFLFYVLNYTLGFYLNINYLLRVPTSVNFSGLRRATLRLIKHVLFLYLAGTSMEAGDPYSASQGNVSHTVGLFEHVNNVLFHGRQNDEGLLRVSSDQEQITLLLENGCYNWPGSDLTVCETFEDGIMNGGLMTATRQFLKNFVTELHAAPPLNSSETSFAGYLLVPAELESLLVLEESFLQVQYTTSVKLYVKEVTEQLDADRLTRNIILAAYLTTILLVYILLVRGIIRSLDNELKRTRRLLLMVPEELYNRLPTLRKFITREFKIGKRRK
ncbi:Hypothetical Protein FCC1311_060572 [Hondaea fermentalgiana]|uniref:TmcB/TmcC TPR repeats domain-containing protein n=1 Tax=Hondaea fermentalgiana TaxID=2315210 RepID=A0A2R5GG28_9STRA|nr:Hypothetical Protein FCC1311_060572 [Hondaea fermentalgiana]|eukprot:GBG29837.1 Hypothetical Protein FCC1311_060572 [Hondaea fermentalgiana]